MSGGAQTADRRGQSMLEYAVILSCVIAALVGMQIYVKRGISGGLRNSADMIGKQYEPGIDEPIFGSRNGFTSSSINTTVTGDTFTKVVTTPFDSGRQRGSSVTETYTVIGPQEATRWDVRFDDTNEDGSEEGWRNAGERKTIIPADSNRKPETTTVRGTETIIRN